MDWIIVPSFPRFNRSLLVSRTAYTKGKLFAVGNGSCWTLVKVYGYDEVRPTVIPTTTTTLTLYVSSTRAITKHTSTVISTDAKFDDAGSVYNAMEYYEVAKFYTPLEYAFVNDDTDFNNLSCFFYKNP